MMMLILPIILQQCSASRRQRRLSSRDFHCHPRWGTLLSSLVLGASLFGCTAATGTQPNIAPGSGNQGPTVLTIATAPGAQLAYTETKFMVHPGAIQVVFRNESIVPHNWTLVRPGDAQRAADEALHNPPTYASQTVIAQTKTLQANQTETLEVTLQEPGTYTFLCTFPGHYTAAMQGTIIVQP